MPSGDPWATRSIAIRSAELTACPPAPISSKCVRHLLPPRIRPGRRAISPLHERSLAPRAHALGPRRQAAAAGIGPSCAAMATPPVPQDLDTFDLLDTEHLRLERFFATLDASGWERPTACAGWRRREMIAHLAGGETYNLACLRDSLNELMASAVAASV